MAVEPVPGIGGQIEELEEGWIGEDEFAAGVEEEGGEMGVGEGAGKGSRWRRGFFGIFHC